MSAAPQMSYTTRSIFCQFKLPGNYSHKTGNAISETLYLQKNFGGACPRTPILGARAFAARQILPPQLLSPCYGTAMVCINYCEKIVSCRNDFNSF